MKRRLICEQSTVLQDFRQNIVLSKFSSIFKEPSVKNIVWSQILPFILVAIHQAIYCSGKCRNYGTIQGSIFLYSVRIFSPLNFFDIGNSFFFPLISFFFPLISFSSFYLFLSLISSPFTHNLFFLPWADLPPPPQVRLYTPVCVFFAYVWYSILCTGQYYGLNCYLPFVPSKHSYQNYNRTPYSLWISA